MTREEFETLRDLLDKVIEGDVVLVRKRENAPVLIAAKVPILNAGGVEAYLAMSYNEETDAKTINVSLTGTGPICRLDVDANRHPPCGRSHKHALMTPDCPRRNLTVGVHDRPDLAGRSIGDVFEAFRAMARIEHRGILRIVER